MGTRIKYAIAATLALGLLALAWPAEAEVVYTPVNVTIEKNGSYNLDVNNDGVTDFAISTYYDYGICNGAYDYANVHETPASGNGAQGAPTYPAELIEGDQIGRSSPFHGGTGTLVYRNLPCGGSVQAGGSWVANGGNGYLGLKFKINGKTHYGWAELNITVVYILKYDFYFVATLTGYAYETIPGEPINAGQTTEADDSSALRPGPVNREDFDLSVSGINPTQALSLGTCALDVQKIPLWRRKEHTEAAPETNSVQSEREIAQLSSQRTL